jgi:hypothetical protein
MDVWMWSVDTEDWEAEGSASAYWVDRIVSLAESEGGSLQHPVVLFHNGQIPMPATVAALPVIIQYFKSHGYSFVDLLGDSGSPAGCSPKTPATPPSATLVEPGKRIAAGEVVDSPGGQYRLVMQPDGDLMLSVASGRELWASGTAGSPRAYAVMQADGDLAIYSHSKRMLWETGTGGHPGADLAVQSDSGLVIYDASVPLWSAGSTNSELGAGERLDPGWYLQSPGGACRLVMKMDGNLALYAANGRLQWASGTSGSPGAFAVVASDGDLVVYSASSHVLWESKTGAKPGARLVVTQQAEVALELPNGSVIWQSS